MRTAVIQSLELSAPVPAGRHPTGSVQMSAFLSAVQGELRLHEARIPISIVVLQRPEPSVPIPARSHPTGSVPLSALQLVAPIALRNRAGRIRVGALRFGFLSLLLQFQPESIPLGAFSGQRFSLLRQSRFGIVQGGFECGPAAIRFPEPSAPIPIGGHPTGNVPRSALQLAAPIALRNRAGRIPIAARCDSVS